VTDLLEDFPRQQRALENAMAQFGDDFNLGQFKIAYESQSDMDAYNRAQSLERAVSRAQNFMADLAMAGSKLAQLKPSRAAPSGEAATAFESLRAGGAISGELCAKLMRAQKARTRIEHLYPGVTAGEIHRAAILVQQASIEYIQRYSNWIVAYL